MVTVALGLTAAACGDASPGATSASSDGGSEALDDADEANDEVGTETGEDGSESGEDGESSETGPACDPGMPEAVEREFLFAGESRADVVLDACDQHVWWIAASADVETTVQIAASEAVEVAIAYPDALAFDQAITTAILQSPGELTFESPRSGEFAVLVRTHEPGVDPDSTLDYAIDVACTNNCQLETTRFPVVMVHGWTGFQNIGPLTYYFNVQADIDALGYPIAVAVLDPYNSVDVRGPQLAAFVEQTLVVQRARKVNLLGHSQGGVDSRWVAADAGAGLGDRIGALITLATPHRGTPVTDVALGLLPGNSEQILFLLLEFLGATQAQQSDAEASLYTLSEAYMQGEFNPTYLDHPGVKYWSWTGETCLAGLVCDDAVDPLLLWSYELIMPFAGVNDGLVPLSSAQWGEFLGTIPADHIDEVGQIAGLTGINYDHIEFFRDNFRMLREHAY